ncbi:hypothetical protein ACFVYG_09090 [Streptomyces sp. NPDC058256]
MRKPVRSGTRRKMTDGEVVQTIVGAKPKAALECALAGHLS